ncbi:hypothetical protein CTheo_5389 [Ceratobasidium theobromae]|uniref:Uncharacterized protein n=1 Tax=Ceratobasidium theobromae TaxID=1582974 RepID=A0A5N5QHH8_9AGAM|nr:hypothetical protein CTheo_5389 [Ceratobasidium theobromae]
MPAGRLLINNTERLIAPERITLPASQSEPSTKLPPEPTKPKPARLAQARRHGPVRANSKPAPIPPPAKSRTVISQAPSALYCSEACREKDQRASERFQLSLETMYSGPSTSTLASPLFVSGSESDPDPDMLTNESYFAQLRVHGKTQRHANPDRDSWADRRFSAGATTTTSSSEDLPTTSSPLTQSPASSHSRTPSSSHGRSKSLFDGNAALYAAYPLTFHRTRSGEGSARSRKNSYTNLHDALVSSSPKDIQVQAVDVTPTQSLYGVDATVSAQGLLVRPALLRAKTERSVVSQLSPPAAQDAAPRLYPPHPSSLPGSKFGFTPVSTPASPTGSRNPSRGPGRGDLARSRRQSDILSQGTLTEASRTRSCDQISTPKQPFMPMYPALMTSAPRTRTVKKWVVERAADGTERLIEKEVVEEYCEERKR